MEVTPHQLFCNFCNRNFFTQTGLRLHIDSHCKGKLNNFEEKEGLYETEKITQPSMANSTEKLYPADDHILTISNESESLQATEPNDRSSYEGDSAVSSLNNNRKGSHLIQTEVKEINVGDRPRPFQCKKCRKEFSCQSDLRAHLRVVHKTLRVPSYQCSECERRYDRKSRLEDHTNIVHKKLQLPSYQCLDCGKRFLRKCALGEHTNSVHKRLKSFQCHICQTYFSHTTSVKVHIAAKHGNLKAHQCQICQKRFTRKFALKAHIDGVHNNLKTFECQMCKKRYAFKKDLQHHLKSYHT
jgi:uncharacterized Zn-finger protein